MVETAHVYKCSAWAIDMGNKESLNSTGRIQIGPLCTLVSKQICQVEYLYIGQILKKMHCLSWQ